MYVMQLYYLTVVISCKVALRFQQVGAGGGSDTRDSCVRDFEIKRSYT